MKKFRWFWAWDDEKEEAWLRSMSNEGWHFQGASLPGFYYFEQGSPRDYVYRLDYLPEKKNKAHYLQLFADAGWAYMGEMNYWQYFRKEAENGEAPEIFSDNESKSRKYERITLLMVVFMPILIINVNNLNKESGTFWDVLTFITFLLLIFFSLAIFKLASRIIQLKKKM